jgi:hypothetical protein
MKPLTLFPFVAAFLAGCLQSLPPLTPAQNCAIGYDMAQHIYQAERQTRSTILAPKTPTECENYALQYLRKSGFAIEPSGNDRLFDIALTPDADGQILAVATLPDGARFARLYRPGPGGVYPASALSKMQAP